MGDIMEQQSTFSIGYDSAPTETQHLLVSITLDYLKHNTTVSENILLTNRFSDDKSITKLLFYAAIQM